MWPAFARSCVTEVTSVAPNSSIRSPSAKSILPSYWEIDLIAIWLSMSSIASLKGLVTLWQFLLLLMSRLNDSWIFLRCIAKLHSFFGVQIFFILSFCCPNFSIQVFICIVHTFLWLNLPFYFFLLVRWCSCCSFGVFQEWWLTERCCVLLPLASTIHMTRLDPDLHAVMVLLLLKSWCRDDGS